MNSEFHHSHLAKIDFSSDFCEHDVTSLNRKHEIVVIKIKDVPVYNYIPDNWSPDYYNFEFFFCIYI